MLVKLETKATIDIDQNVSCLLLGTCTKQIHVSSNKSQIDVEKENHSERLDSIWGELYWLTSWARFKTRFVLSLGVERLLRLLSHTFWTWPLTKYCWYFLGVKIEATREETSFFFNLSDKHPCYLTIALPTHHPPPPSIRLRPKGSVIILFSCVNNRMWLSQSLENWRSALTYIPKSSTNNSIWDSDGPEVIPVSGVMS